MSPVARRSSDLDRRTVGDAQRPEREQPVGAGDGRGDERHSGLQRDPRRAGACARLVLLHEPLLAPRPLGEHHDDVALLREAHGRLDRLDVGAAAADREGAGGVERSTRRPPVELRLRHEAEPAPRPERHAERPRVEVREVIAGEDVTAARGQVLPPLHTQPEQPVEDRPAEPRRRRCRGAADARPEYHVPKGWLS